MILRRLRAFAGGLGMLGLLALAAALLLTATPHLANQYTDRGLQDWIGSLGYRVKDVSYTIDERVTGDPRLGQGAQIGEAHLVVSCCRASPWLSRPSWAI